MFMEGEGCGMEFEYARFLSRLFVNAVERIAVDKSIRGEAVTQAKVRPMVEAENILVTQIAVDVNERFPICKFRKNWPWNTLTT
jgi:hypothetical protein